MRAPAHVYEAETRGIVVRVRPTYLDGPSDPAEGRWIWAYAVEIENRTDRPVRLVARRWRITDGRGRVQHVSGPGVVGQQPWIAPGGVHRYVSSCRLGTDTGMMAGAYVMMGEGGETFEAEIPAFCTPRRRSGR